ncbi:DnaA/Hda family protein [Roseimaritima ulvae]|uniref:Chromosomal replication initiator protein DnaA n=1 Tax=Roseimaritima ulvae TaxID=980254 RepID=A0A5B9QG94_9BACT|nr:DnaA/Hda family protein [Roseimaritima ulvae]QEG38048.1 Chromosomal replication initiator protein DnaA [Roseimaritima ulvae]
MTIDTIELKQPDLSHRRGRRSQSSWLLSDFVTGQENAFAAFVCRQSESIAQCGNPLLLVGPTGCGKTALAMTIACHELMLAGDEDDPASMLYLAAADFARNYANAVSADDLEHFRNHIASADLLLIDDIHTIVDKVPAQEELAARIEARVRAAAPTIVTCRRLPSELRGIRPLLASRMLPGLTVPLALPSGDARREIVWRLCQQAELEIDVDWVDVLCRSLPEDFSAPRLAAVVNHLRLLSEHGDALDAPAIRSAIDAVCGGSEPTIASIAKAVARRFKLKTSELKSSTRRQQVVRARSLAMYLGRQLTESSFQQIGEYFGGRDHSTVLHACRKTEALLVSNSQLSQTADEVSEQLRSAS